MTLPSDISHLSPHPPSSLSPSLPRPLPLPSFPQALKSLVDYDEDSDEEDKTDEHIESPAKRKKLDDS